jgi:hypothetical protein
MDMNLGHSWLSSRTDRRLETPAGSRRSGREFGGIITSSAVTATLDVGFARRDAAVGPSGVVSTRSGSLLTACFRMLKAVQMKKKSIDG